MKDAQDLSVKLDFLTFALCRFAPAHTYVHTCSGATTAHYDHLFLFICVAVKDVKAMHLLRPREAELNAASAARRDR
jgi:hypothetical protein